MVPPVVERELRVALLRRKARRQWTNTALQAGGITAAFLALFLLTRQTSGRMLFYYLFGFGIFWVAQRAFALTSDLFSEERRNGTLGLLVLAGLSPLEIFAHKLLGALALAGYGQLGALPFFALPFLMGGITAQQFVCALVFLANGLCFCVALGLLASVLHRDGGQAQVTAQAIAVLLCAVSPGMYWAMQAAAKPLSAAWLVVSPGYPAYLVFTAFASAPPRWFWLGSMVTAGYAVTALVLAAIVLQLTWRREATAREERGGWWGWMRRDASRRRRLRGLLFAGEPFCWLAARDRRPIIAAYGVLVFVVLVWLAGWAILGAAWIKPGYALLTSLFLHLALNTIVSFAAARTLAGERLSGGFEVLLSMPLRAEELVEGQRKALVLQFRPLFLLALLVDFALCASGYAVLPQGASSAAIYLVGWILLLLFWFAVHFESATRAMWIGTWTGRSAFAALKANDSYWFIFLWTWFMWDRRQGGVFPQSGLAWVFSGIMVLVALSLFGRRRRVRQKLVAELRLIATSPIPARDDPRFKKWLPEDIRPLDSWGRMIPPPVKPRKKRKPPEGPMDTLNG